jgi:hypothetical protein
VNPNNLAGRYFWTQVYLGVAGIYQYTLYFTNDTYVYTGKPTGSWPTCTEVTTTCKTYTYDSTTGTLTINDKSATLKGLKLTYGGATYWQLGAAAAGARWDTTLTYSNSIGTCPDACTDAAIWYAFAPDGRFIRGNGSSSTNIFSTWVVTGNDRKGTYEVRADRTLQLTYADGTQQILTLGIYPADDLTYPTNPTAGIILNGTGYLIW